MTVFSAEFPFRLYSTGRTGEKQCAMYLHQKVTILTDDYDRPLFPRKISFHYYYPLHFVAGE